MNIDVSDEFGFYKLFWIFVIGCFLGVVIETLWCMLRYHKIESRKGLVWGPFNLVYGFGALVMTLGLQPVMDEKTIHLFCVGAILGGAYEYICSVVQEKTVGTVSWDYTNFPLNLHGRINVIYCFFWGILALFWGKELYPLMSDWIAHIPVSVGIPLTKFGILFFVIDTLHSACVVYRMNDRLDGNPSAHKFWRFYDRFYPDEKVRKIYPNMKFGCTLNAKTNTAVRNLRWRLHFPL